jgi:hypothetical protein
MASREESLCPGYNQNLYSGLNHDTTHFSNVYLLVSAWGKLYVTLSFDKLGDVPVVPDSSYGKTCITTTASYEPGWWLWFASDWTVKSNLARFDIKREESG